MNHQIVLVGQPVKSIDRAESSQLVASHEMGSLDHATPGWQLTCDRYLGQVCDNKNSYNKKQNQTKTSESPITGKTVQVEADNRNASKWLSKSTTRHAREK